MGKLVVASPGATLSRCGGTVYCARTRRAVTTVRQPAELRARQRLLRAERHHLALQRPSAYYYFTQLCQQLNLLQMSCFDALQQDVVSVVLNFTEHISISLET